MGIRLVCLCAAVAACNQIYDLEETVPRVDDADADHVLDDEDNCPAQPNTDQANADGDRFGDACDLCPTLAADTEHDEDGDYLGDACDPCPSVPDYHLDADADGVGDACDHDQRVSRRRVFDPFVTLGPPFQAGGQPWEALGDEIAPGGPPPPTDPGYIAPSIQLSGTYWIEVGIRSSRAWTDGDRLGIELVDATTGQPAIRCAVVCAPTCRSEFQLDAAVSSGSSLAMPLAIARVVVGPDPSRVSCRIGNAMYVATWLMPRAVRPVLRAMPGVKLRYVEVVE